MTSFAPHKCPKCGSPKVQMQVIAWGEFTDGKLDILDQDQGVATLIEPAAVACCNDECGHEWEWEQVS